MRAQNGSEAQPGERLLPRGIDKPDQLFSPVTVLFQNRQRTALSRQPYLPRAVPIIEDDGEAA
jgi:hypothetical protein